MNMTEKDMRLLAAVFLAAREAAGGEPRGDLQRALDEFDLRATFTVPT